MDYEHKKKINEKLNNVKDKEIFYNIFDVIKSDLYDKDGKKKFTENNNGIFFDLNLISEENLNKIDNILNEYFKT